MYDLNMDSLTGLGALGFAAISKYRKYSVWKPGDKLKILLVGYNGKRNTGADVRVAAMVEQFYKSLGRDKVEIGVLTLDEKMTEVYFSPPTRQIQFSAVFFKDLLNACSDYHIAVLSEGSTLKSKFANALTFFFCEAAGIMKNQEKPCIAYGSEAGKMDPLVYDLSKYMCKNTYFIARTEPSLKIIGEMGLKGHLGTDTAWTFPPADRAWAEKELREKAGWDGKKPIIGVAAINPFCWPVKPNLFKFLKAKITGNWANHYDKWYFFTSSKERENQYRHYIDGLAKAANLLKKEKDALVVTVGMEALDFEPINNLASKIDGGAMAFSSRFYDGYQLSSILHSLSALVTSRYHARVLSMNGGIPSAAVSMDERLYNIFQECGHLNDYYLTVDDPDLGEKLFATMEKLWERRDTVRLEIRKSLPRYLHMMSDMGKFFRGFVEKSFPGIELGPAPADWTGYLPDLHPGLKNILEESPG
jgi:polysaccharide pyruvyl transferase WcaK-like protein